MQVPLAARRMLELARGGRLLLAVGALGLFARLVLSWFVVGTNDALTWQDFAQGVEREGVSWMYAHVRDFNHPPLMGYLAAFALETSRAVQLPFFFVFRLPVLLAEVASALVLYRVWKRLDGRTAALAWALYGWNPDSLLVSAYHTNTDALCAMLCLLACYAWEGKRPVGAGLALGAAINVKLIPVLLVPVFLVRVSGWKGLARFGGALAAGALPFAPFLLSDWRSFHRNALAYNSNFDNWGLPLFVREALLSERLRPFAHSAQSILEGGGRYAVLAAAIALAVWCWRRGVNTYVASSLVMAAFLVLTPGFGVQYTVYAVPVLFASSLRWGALYAVASGLFVALVYYLFWTGSVPLQSAFTTPFPRPSPLLGLFAWAILVWFVVSRLRSPDADLNREGAMDAR